MSHNISDELYNSIKNAKTLEDLAIIQTSLESSENSSVIISNNIISIRILSCNEFSKYIENDTLNGSILKQGENVWHINSGNIGQSFFVSCLYNNGGSSQSNYLYHYPNVTYIHRTTTSQNNTTNTYVNYELMENNISNNCDMKNISRVFDITIWWFGNWSEKGTTQQITLNEVQTLTKNNISIIKTLQKVTVNMNGGWSETLNIIMYSSFRPIFQYVDNNKSENIFN